LSENNTSKPTQSSIQPTYRGALCLVLVRRERILLLHDQLVKQLRAALPASRSPARKPFVQLVLLVLRTEELDFLLHTMLNFVAHESFSIQGSCNTPF
jgi:hypothetical protein